MIRYEYYIKNIITIFSCSIAKMNMHYIELIILKLIHRVNRNEIWRNRISSLSFFRTYFVLAPISFNSLNLSHNLINKHRAFSKFKNVPQIYTHPVYIEQGYIFPKLYNIP